MSPLEILNSKDNTKEVNDENENENSKRNELLTELKEREQLYNNIVKSNKEIKEKINFTNKKYDDILKRIEDKKNKDMEQKLKNQINEIDKEIEAYRNENKNYKKTIGQLKNSVYFKNTVANAAAMQNILKQEKLKNKEYISELNTLKRIQKINNNYITNYEKEYKMKENIDYVNKQIKEIKESIKLLTDDYNLLEKYFKLIHEKIIGMDIKTNVKKNEVKEIKNEEEKKSFKNEEVKDVIEVIISLRNQIMEKRAKLNNINSGSEGKMNEYFAQNRYIEIELKENLKKYKDLTSKRANLKKEINKLTSKKNRQKSKAKLLMKTNNSKNIDQGNIKKEIDNNSKTILNDSKNRSKDNIDNTLDKDKEIKKDIINDIKENNDNIEQIKKDNVNENNENNEEKHEESPEEKHEEKHEEKNEKKQEENINENKDDKTNKEDNENNNIKNEEKDITMKNQSKLENIETEKELKKKNQEIEEIKS